MRKQSDLFFAALQFYTRIPVPKWALYKPENLGPATRFLPLIGWVVGLISAVVYLVVSFLTDNTVGVIAAVIASILTTGALHEDGFADTCDGFGGGWTKDKILLIMKDSRVGTYGVVGLVCLLILKCYLLQALLARFGADWLLVVSCWVSAHALSRLMPALVIYKQPYARDTSDSKSKPVAENVSAGTVAIAAIWALIPVFCLTIILKNAWTLAIIGLLLIVTWRMSRYFGRWIGGYTGDCLGAVQQVCEVVFYFLLMMICKFS